MDTYAADVAELAAALDLREAVHVGHLTGGGEVARFVARHGKGRVATAALIGAVPPIMVKTEKNPAACRSTFSTASARRSLPAARSSSSMCRADCSMASTGKARRCLRA